MSQTYLVGEKYLNTDHYESGRDSGDNENMYIGDNGDITRWTYLAPLRDRAGFGSAIRFGSAHSTGFHVVFCDGSVHAMSFNLDPVIHARLGNRKDGNVIDASAY
jgi:hypothetical protein